MTPQELAFADNSIEVNMAKLSVLISRFQASVSRDQRNASAKEYFFQTLEVWASELPQKLRYCAGPSDSDSLQAIEAGSVSQASVICTELRTDYTSFIWKYFTLHQ